MEPEVDRPRLGVPPPVWWAVALAAAFALDRWAPGSRWIEGGARWIGAPLLAAGLAMNLLGAGLFLRKRTPLVPFTRSTTVVRGGIFRYTRNPMYLGMLLILAGFAAWLGSATAWLPLPVLAAVLHYRFVLREERFMEDLFGQEYLDYKRRVRRWI